MRGVSGLLERIGELFPTATVLPRPSLPRTRLSRDHVGDFSERGARILNQTLASNLSARVGSLIAHHHAGDPRAAAAQLGLEHHELAGLLTGDWRQFSLGALAVIVRAYDVGPAWLFATTTGSEASTAHPPRMRSLPKIHASLCSPSNETTITREEHP
jgi:hypothetical protein